MFLHPETGADVVQTLSFIFEVMRVRDTVLSVRKLASKAGERLRLAIILNMPIIKYFNT